MKQNQTILFLRILFEIVILPVFVFIYPIILSLLAILVFLKKIKINHKTWISFASIGLCICVINIFSFMRSYRFASRNPHSSKRKQDEKRMLVVAGFRIMIQMVMYSILIGTKNISKDIVIFMVFASMLSSISLIYNIQIGVRYLDI